MKIIRLFIISSLLIFMIQCNLFSQQKQAVPHFNQIHLFGKIEVRLEAATQDSVLIESTDIDTQKVQVIVENEVLKIKLTSELTSQIKVKATVYYSELRHLEAGGGIKLYNKGTLEAAYIIIEAKSGSEFDLLVAADSAQVLVNKEAFVRVTGVCPKVTLKTSTGGDYRATALENDTTMVKMLGGTAELDVKKYLDADVRLGASLKYKTEPEKIHKTLKLGGTISILEEY